MGQFKMSNFDLRSLEYIYRLDEIARKVFHNHHGSFLTTFADAWLRADKQNKEILKAVWIRLILKYRLYLDLGR